MATASNPLERPTAPSTLKESVDAVLTKKESPEQGSAVQPVAEGVQTEVADLLSGVESAKPKEKVSEKAQSRAGEKKAAAGGAAITSQQAAILADFKNQPLPAPEVMIQRIRVKIRDDIQNELRKANKLAGSLSKGSAHEYATMIARVRRLQHLLRQLLTATVDFIKDLYMRLFTPSGKPRGKSVL